MTVPAPTVGRFVQVNIASRSIPPVWRPALVVAAWPDEFPSHLPCAVGVNVQVFLDGTNDEFALRCFVGQSYDSDMPPPGEIERVMADCRRGTRWVTSLPHEALLGAQPDYRGMVWRWPPLEGA